MQIKCGKGYGIHYVTQCKLSGHSFHCLPDCRSLFSVKDVIIYDLGMDAWQNHLVGTVSLSGGGNLERS